MGVQYIPLSVRVRAWNRSLLSRDELLKLLDKEVDTIIHELDAKEKYSSFDNSNSQELLKSLHLSIFNYLQLASKISTGASKKIIQELFHYLDMENLKYLVRMLVSGNFQQKLMHYDSIGQISTDRLSEIRNFAELSSFLQNTIYSTLTPVLDQVALESNALYWEVALDNFYVSRLVHVSHFIDGDSQKAIRQLMLLPLHYERLITLYRYRFHYGVDPGEALQYVPNLTNLLSYEEWARFVFANSPEEFYQLLLENSYLSSDQVANHASALRADFNYQLEKICRRYTHGELTSIASFLAFIQLKKIQYQKIITIIESKILNVPESDILQFL